MLGNLLYRYIVLQQSQLSMAISEHSATVSYNWFSWFRNGENALEKFKHAKQKNRILVPYNHLDLQLPYHYAYLNMVELNINLFQD